MTFISMARFARIVYDLLAILLEMNMKVVHYELSTYEFI